MYEHTSMNTINFTLSYGCTDCLQLSFVYLQCYQHYISFVCHFPMHVMLQHHHFDNVSLVIQNLHIAPYHYKIIFSHSSRVGSLTIDRLCNCHCFISLYLHLMIAIFDNYRVLSIFEYLCSLSAKSASNFSEIIFHDLLSD